MGFVKLTHILLVDEEVKKLLAIFEHNNKRIIIKLPQQNYMI